MDKDIAKYTFGFLLKTVLDVFNKFKIVTLDDRKQFFKDNPELWLMYLSFTPFQVFITDKNGYKASMPNSIYDDDNFIFPEEANGLISDSISIFIWNDLLQDEFYKVGQSINRLKLSQEDRNHIYWVFFCNILSKRIEIWKSIKPFIDPVSTIDEDTINQLQSYQCFIDLEDIDTDKLRDIQEQIVYFTHMVQYEQWRSLVLGISDTLKHTYYELVNEIAKTHSDNPLEGYNFICDVHYEINLERALNEQLMRNTYKEYDEYTLKIFEITKNHLQEKIRIIPSANFQLTMGDQYNINQAGAVGPNSTVNNSTFNQTNYDVLADADYDSIAQELTSLKEYLRANATAPEHFVAVSEVANAEIASQEKNGKKLIKHLTNAGKWAWDTTKEIGANVLAELISKQIVS